MALGDDDRQWRRPSGPPEPPPASPTPASPPYVGPPRSTPPPRGWQPRTLIQVPPPRALPPQDQPALDAQEQQARTVTFGVAMVAGAILLVVLFVVCGRALL
ncbi:MAG TPA: translation initiation factor 2 [Rugosimonospora sp.]|nr:translation initiation factor 2 [Rugosimonospora sp.]